MAGNPLYAIEGRMRTCLPKRQKDLHGSNTSTGGLNIRAGNKREPDTG